MYRNWFLYVISTSFFVSFFLFYFELPPLGSKNVVQIKSEDGHSISSVSLSPNSMFVGENALINNGVKHVDGTGTGADEVHEAEDVKQLDAMEEKVSSEKEDTKAQSEENIPSEKEEIGAQFEENVPNEKEDIKAQSEEKVPSEKEGIKVQSEENVPSEGIKAESDPCSGKYIYVYDLPSKFNGDMLRECQIITPYEDMCSFLSNEGYGPKVENREEILTDEGWFNTHLFSLGVIFHSRMKQYKCQTNTSSLASAIYVPFYAGIDIFRHLWGSNTTMRDSTAHSLIKWLSTRPEWQALGGRDHFLVSGRATWEHRRITDEDSDWGNKLMLLPEIKNMTTLLPAASPWHSHDFAIPYPSYFHPSTDSEVIQWQEKMRRHKRESLFCFAGNPRPKQVGAIRNKIIEQCQKSNGKCKWLGCGEEQTKCHSVSYLIELFQNSVFCLQPPGDDPTRRSTFDSLLSGCIPVLFHPLSAYTQYIWHLPQNYSKYSVYIPEDDLMNGNVSIELILSRISNETVTAMRDEIIRVIPKLMYVHPRARMETIEDAFDITVKRVIERVNELKKEIKEGSYSSLSGEKEYAWKYNLFGRVEEHQWDHYFKRGRKL